MGVFKKIGAWLTGRDEKESDVYANYGKVADVVSNIKSIGSHEVEDAKDDLNEAINKLNNVNGVAQYVGTVSCGAFNSVFESITQSVNQIGDQLQNKADDIKAYEESPWYEKAASTICMSAAKLGEGILSVAEDIGDGVVSIVGWVAPKDSGLEKACKNFVEKEWAHDTFNFYYNSDFAKKSAFTEDSGIASGLKIVGSTVGYLALGGAISGAGGALSAAAQAGKVGKVAATAGKVLSSTTRVNTALAALGGMGTGTEAGLKQGLDFDAAAWKGAKQGAVQGAIAYGAGKLGEKASAKKINSTEGQAAAEAAKNEAQLAEKAVNTAKTKAQTAMETLRSDMGEAAEGLTDKALLKAAKKSADEGLKYSAQLADDAANAVTKAESQYIKSLMNVDKATIAQGYTDAITRKGQDVGANAMTNVIENGVVKGTMKNAGAVLKTAVTPVTATAGAVKNGVQNVAQNGIKGSVKAAGSTATTAVKNATSTVAGGTKSLAKGAVNAVTHPISTLSNAVKAVPSVAKTAAKAAISPVGVTAANAVGRELVSKSSDMFTVDSDAVITAKNAGSLSDTPVNSYYYADYTVGRDAIVETDPSYMSTTSGEISTGGTGGGYTGTSGGYVSTGGGYTGTGGGYVSTGNTTSGNSNEQFTPSELKPSTIQENTTKPTEIKPSVDNPIQNQPSTPSTPSTPTPTQTTTPTPSNNPTPSTSSPTQQFVTPAQSTTTTTTHTGGGYTGTGGYTSSGSSEFTGTEEVLNPVEEAIKNNVASIDDVIKGNKYTKIPTSSKAISTTTSKSSGGQAVIPIAAGLSAAAAAGIGAKAYMDRKKNNSNGEDDDFDTEEWSGEDAIEIGYDDSSDTETFDEDDDYGFQDEGSYSARNNEELADLQ